MTDKQEYKFMERWLWVLAFGTLTLFLVVIYTNVCSTRFVVGTLSFIVASLIYSLIRKFQLAKRITELNDFDLDIENIGQN